MPFELELLGKGKVGFENHWCERLLLLFVGEPFLTSYPSHFRTLTALSVPSRAGLGGARRGVEWPELGGDGLARVEVVREGGSEQLLR